MNAGNTLVRIWNKTKKVFRILFNARISLLMMLFSYVLCFHVDQVQDAIVGFGDFRTSLKMFYLSLVGILWAAMVWYWLHCFYFLEYADKKLDPLESTIVRYLPPLLGFLSLLIIGGAFLHQGIASNSESCSDLVKIGFVFIGYSVLFTAGVILKINAFDRKHTGMKAVEGTGFGHFSSLSLPSRIVLIGTTIISGIFLIILSVNPYIAPHLGAAISILFTCMLIWLPFLYWVVYIAKRSRLPVFGALIMLVAVFSLFNSNNNVREIGGSKHDTTTLMEYFMKWYQQRTGTFTNDTTGERVPLIMVLSEGGGIRAAYWSASLLGRLEREYPGFSRYIFGIQGVSGGSFGATVYASLLKHYLKGSDDSVASQDSTLTVYQKKATEIIGKDYLSPLLASLLTRGVIQLLVPVPISSFDPAKVFEKTWEKEWRKAMHITETDGCLFSGAFLSLWKSFDTLLTVPQLFINSTRVENGYPVVISSLDLPWKTDTTNSSRSTIGITKNFYQYCSDSVDVRVSTAALLSARFPFVTPAGILYSDSDDVTRTVGLVDGGYYDNSGANLALCIFMYLKEMLEKYELINTRIGSVTEKSTDSTFFWNPGDSIIQKINSIYPEIEPYLSNSMRARVGRIGVKHFSSGKQTETSLKRPLQLDELLQPRGRRVPREMTQRHSLFQEKIMPVVIYLKNGSTYADSRKSGRSPFYQLTAPVTTVFEVRDAFSQNSLDRIEEFVAMFDGKFIPLSLQEPAPVAPLGWTLSETAQKSIDERVEEIMTTAVIRDTLRSVLTHGD